jgi:hypothetical protein
VTPLLVFLALAGFETTRVAAQGVTTAAVGGTVTSTTGQLLTGVQVSVTDTRTGVTTGGLTNAQGQYFVAHLQPGGPYVVRAQLLGYREEQRENVRLTLNQTQRVDFALEQTAVQLDPLRVTIERSPVFSRSRTGTTTTIPESEISSFPTVSRSILDFASLSPQVTTAEGSISIAGQNNRFNNLQIDGAVNNDVFGLADTGIPGGQAGAKAISLEAIQEFQIFTAPFDVRHSGFTGGLINAVTKTGTNTFTGSLFGFHTNNDLLSDLETGSVADFNDTQFGFNLGGPLIRDRLHFFVNGEFQLQDSPNPGPGFAPGGALTPGAIEAGIHPDTAARVIDILTDQYGIQNVGTTDAISLDNPRTNLFGRLDWAISDRHRAVFRHNYARARRDLSAFRVPGTFALTSNLAPFNTSTNTSVFQLFSRLGGRWNNELLLNVEFVRDKRDPAVAFPQIEVGVASNINGQVVTSEIIAGAERFSQANSLDQNVVQLTNNLTGEFGNHRVTVGTHNEYFKFSNVFFEGSIGIYEFASVAALAANNPFRYQIRSTGSGISDPATEFSVLQVGGYVQDEWLVNDQLTLTLGVRADVPLMLDDPRSNPAVATAFGQATTEVPSGNIVLQPRFGFNWNSLAERQTQVRGGIGIFSGRAPYVWISNAYGNTGLESTFLTCTTGNIPALDPDNYPGNEPRACANGATGAGDVSFVNLVDPDFKFPTDLKLSFGIDQELPGQFSLTAEALYTKAINSVFMEELNLQGQQGTDASQGNRPIFGTPHAVDGYRPLRVDSRFPQVVRLTNNDKDRALLLTLELQRRFADWLRFRGSYTYADVDDVQGLISSQATSNYGRNAIGGDPNDPQLTNSTFERPHRVLVSATGQWALGNGFLLEVSPQYFGQSGQPYSFVARGDLNGDGYRSGAVSRDNDLIYIPNNVSEMAFRLPADAQAFEELISSHECLDEQRGQIMERNSCRNPWSSRLDTRVILGIPGGWRGGQLQLVADVINLFAWELERTATTDRGVEALRVRGRVGNSTSGALLFDYTGPRSVDGADPTPLTLFTPQSQRQIQLGLRYNF